MATKGTTTRAAIYTRKSSLDERDGDNRLLSAIRAEAVRTQLLARGVEPERLVTLGMGHRVLRSSLKLRPLLLIRSST